MSVPPNIMTKFLETAGVGHDNLNNRGLGSGLSIYKLPLPAFRPVRQIPGRETNFYQVFEISPRLAGEKA